jgi:hypothetical protein
MTKSPHAVSLVPALATIALLGTACVSMDKQLGEDFIPNSQQLHTRLLDATPYISLHTVTLDSLATNGLSTAVLGRMDDPELGSTTAGFVTQFVPTNTAYAFEEDVTGLDSVFLFIGFSGTYGVNKKPMDIEVYELQTAINDSAYYGTRDVAEALVDMNKNLAVSGQKFGADTTSVYIKLDNELRQKMWGSLAADSFASRLHGLYVTVKNDGSKEGSIKSTVMSSSSSYSSDVMLVAYYHYRDTVNGGTDSTKTVFYYTYGQPHFNVVDHDNTSANPNPTTLYMQGLSGRATELRINRQALLDTLHRISGADSATTRYALNRAQLVLSIRDDDMTNVSTLSQYPTQLRCTTHERDTTGHIVYYSTRDIFAYDGSISSTFDGTLNRSQMSYSLNITHYTNDVLSGREDKPTQVMPYYFSTSMEVARINNSSSPTDPRRPMLKLTYTEIRE